MNIHLCVPFKEIDWLGNITRILKNSIKDIGFILTSQQEADVIIAVQHFPLTMEKRRGVKYILYQIEQHSYKSASVESYYAFRPNEVWGFDIENKNERYVPLGYHPCLEFDRNFQDIDVSFMGCITEKRHKWFSKVKHSPKQVRGFAHKVRGQVLSRTKINLNLHAYGMTQFTEWDRISHFLANSCFFISEHFYCPIDVPQFKTVDQYDLLVDYFLKNAEEREEKAVMANKIYKRDFDMRNILKEIL